MTLVKLFLFGLILILMVFAALATYRLLNRKIIGSDRIISVVGFSLLMFIINAGILLGGIYLLIILYKTLVDA